MKVIFDVNSYKELIITEEYQLLSEYFQMDVQSNGGEYELGLLREFQKSGLEMKEIGVRNAFDLTFFKETIQIENMFTDKILKNISINFYEKCLLEWINTKR
ncbi:hypothetical protein [Sphingobacterium bovistauri]|uniref:Uncharacterized protein n=1 Tax=Sphingobacterium bovistauri TaxID=2781959 RepID=A0ABS7Z966_9SPHI|nr:hypothetical protein [Sphingobacterium bovistauri]MCA5005234.1 hypothetical protein [Sphingobacterium bovistauri]